MRNAVLQSEISLKNKGFSLKISPKTHGISKIINLKGQPYGMIKTTLKRCKKVSDFALSKKGDHTTRMSNHSAS